VDDSFKHSVTAGATFCGQPLVEWLRAAGVPDSEVWSAGTPEAERTLWNARLFPASTDPDAYLQWLWMLDVNSATADQKARFLAADRYSSSEIAVRGEPRTTPTTEQPEHTSPRP
jgi:hypothetical protein